MHRSHTIVLWNMLLNTCESTGTDAGVPFRRKQRQDTLLLVPLVKLLGDPSCPVKVLQRDDWELGCGGGGGGGGNIF